MQIAFPPGRIRQVHHLELILACLSSRSLRRPVFLISVSFSQSVCLSVCLSVSLCVYLSVHLSVSVSLWPSIHEITVSLHRWHFPPCQLRRLSDSRRVVENTELEPSRRHATTAAGAGPSRQPAAGGPGVTPTADAALPSLWETSVERMLIKTALGPTVPDAYFIRTLALALFVMDATVFKLPLVKLQALPQMQISMPASTDAHRANVHTRPPPPSPQRQAQTRVARSASNARWADADSSVLTWTENSVLLSSKRRCRKNSDDWFTSWKQGYSFREERRVFLYICDEWG